MVVVAIGWRRKPGWQLPCRELCLLALLWAVSAVAAQHQEAGEARGAGRGGSDVVPVAAADRPQRLRQLGESGGSLRRRLDSQVVQLQVFYKINCAHCKNLMEHGVQELVNARIPGDRLRITILPMIKPPKSQQGCREDSLCAGALPPLCALKPLMPEPLPADHARLPKTMKFLVCHLGHTAGSGATPESVPTCAAEAGLDAEELESCVTGDEIFKTMYSEDYGGRISAAIQNLVGQGFPDHILAPWIFLDDTLLSCEGDGCSGEQHPGGVKPLKDAGSLLHIVCARLDPPPAGCEQGGREDYHPEPVHASLRACANCMEVGVFGQDRQWSNHNERHAAESHSLLAFAGMASMGMVAFLGWRSRCQHHPSQSPRDNFSTGPPSGPE